MAERRLPRALARFLSDYGMSLVLLLLCVYYSCVTFAEQNPTGAAGGGELARTVLARVGSSGRVLIVTGTTQDDAAFADALRQRLEAAGVEVAADVRGRPSDARAALQRLAKSGGQLNAIAANQTTSDWPVLQDVGTRFPTLGDVTVLTPKR